ncbi:hypothetical protein [Kocuria arenosa]|uniref:hypothetical protein n=1 Tax=Kocuria arenosa TaxID=3071446 RepID=UPI0034D3FFAB
MTFACPVWFRLHGVDRGLIWQTDDGTQTTYEDSDTVLVLDRRVVTALTAEALAELADRHGLALEDAEDQPLDLDGLDHLLELAASKEICSQLMNAWNLYGDIARSLEATLHDDGQEAQRCYDKLFYGNNLPTITPAGGQYRPYLTDAEQHLIRGILTRGRAILATHL